MFSVKSVEEVFGILDYNFSNYDLSSETVRLEASCGRIAAVDLVSQEDIPGFNRSSVDGYAVKASDTFGCSESIPAQLVLKGEVHMGEKPGFILEKGEAAYVPTGGELPQGADAMVMVEYSEDFGDGFIYLNKPAAPGNSVVFTGDDIKVDSVAVKAGTLLKPQHVGALAALGISEVPVKRKLTAGIISTGDEIVPVTHKLSGAKVRDINSYTAYAGILALGGSPRLYGIIPDNADVIKQTVEKAVSECDIVLISGGSSVGTKDHTLNVIDSLGKPGVLVHGIAVKPGKPTIIGRAGNKAIIGLPGHPASAYFIFKIFVEYLVNVMYGNMRQQPASTDAVMEVNYPSNNGREEYLPVKLEYKGDKLTAHPVFGKSGMITMLTTADGYVRISRGSEGIKAGQAVEVILFN